MMKVFFGRDYKMDHRSKNQHLCKIKYLIIRKYVQY